MTRREFKKKSQILIRKGQSEIIGGLIVLTILFLLAFPMLLGYVNNTSEIAKYASEKTAQSIEVMNEKLSIQTVPPSHPLFPAIIINNTGTVTAQIDAIYLYDTSTNSVIAILDMKTLRPDTVGSNDLVEDLILAKYTSTLPPAGTPIPLNPGDSIIVKVNATHPLIQGNEASIAVRVVTASGLIYPIQETGGAGGASVLTLAGSTLPAATGTGSGSGGSGSGGAIVDLWTANISDAALLEIEFKAEFEPLYGEYAVIHAYAIEDVEICMHPGKHHGWWDDDDDHDDSDYTMIEYMTPASSPFKMVNITIHDDDEIEDLLENIILTNTGDSCIADDDEIEDLLDDITKIILVNTLPVSPDKETYLVTDIIMIHKNGTTLQLSDICPPGGFVPHKDLSDPIDVRDEDGDGYYEIVISTDSIEHYKGMRDYGFAIIGLLSSDTIELTESSDLAIVLAFNFSMNKAKGWHPDAAGNPLVGITLYKDVNGTLVPVDYYVLTYSSIKASDYKGGLLPILITEVFHDVEPGTYRIGITLIDAAPFASVTFSFDRISIFIVEE